MATKTYGVDDITDGMLIEVPDASSPSPPSISSWSGAVAGKTVCLRFLALSSVIEYFVSDDPSGKAQGSCLKSDIIRRLNVGYGKVVITLTSIPLAKFETPESVRLHEMAKHSGYGLPDARLALVAAWLQSQGLQMVPRGTIVLKGSEVLRSESGGWLLHTVPKNTVMDAGCVIFATLSDTADEAPKEVEKDAKEDEHARMCRFFFGRPPTDQSKLPSAPKVVGTTWDELADW